MPGREASKPARKPAYGTLSVDLTNPITSRLAFALPFNEGAGPSWDQGPYQIGQDTGPGPIAWTSGVLGPQGSLNGTRILTFGTALPLRTTGPLSICAGVIHDGTATDRAIVGWNQTGATTFEWRIDATNHLDLLKEQAVDIGADSATVSANTLVHVGVTYNGTTARYYISGSPTGTAVSAQTFSYSATDTFNVGSSNVAEVFIGSMAYVYVWTRTLSATEMLDIATAPFQIWRPALLRRWFVVTVQVARPTSDVFAGGWTTDAGLTTGLYARVDETTPDDTNYIQSSLTPSADAVTLTLDSLLAPIAGTCTLKYRYGKNSAGMQVNLTVELLQAGVVVQTWTHTDISVAFVEADQSVTGVTDYTQPLSITFTANQL